MSLAISLYHFYHLATQVTIQRIPFSNENSRFYANLRESLTTLAYFLSSALRIILGGRGEGRDLTLRMLPKLQKKAEQFFSLEKFSSDQ
jgi:hypothetical protein